MEFEKFVGLHGDRIHYMIHRLGVKGDWYDEFYGEGLVALWHAYQEFDGKRAEVGTFLNYRIRFRLIDLMRKKFEIRRRNSLLMMVLCMRLIVETVIVLLVLD